MIIFSTFLFQTGIIGCSRESCHTRVPYQSTNLFLCMWLFVCQWRFAFFQKKDCFQKIRGYADIRVGVSIHISLLLCTVLRLSAKIRLPLETIGLAEMQHQKSGSKYVIDLYHNVHRVICVEFGSHHSRHEFHDVLNEKISILRKV